MCWEHQSVTEDHMGDRVEAAAATGSAISALVEEY